MGHLKNINTNFLKASNDHCKQVKYPHISHTTFKLAENFSKFFCCCRISTQKDSDGAVTRVSIVGMI